MPDSRVSLDSMTGELDNFGFEDYLNRELRSPCPVRQPIAPQPATSFLLEEEIHIPGRFHEQRACRVDDLRLAIALRFMGEFVSLQGRWVWPSSMFNSALGQKQVTERYPAFPAE